MHPKRHLQIVTVLSRLAARRYEEALVAQGAVPMLLEMLTVTDNHHSDYCRRIRYKVRYLGSVLMIRSHSSTRCILFKAAVCIGTLAATGVGLKALYVNHGEYKCSSINAIRRGVWRSQ